VIVCAWQQELSQFCEAFFHPHEMQQTTKIRLKFWLIGTIGVILLAYLGVCTAFYFYQDRLIFRPAQISTLDLAARAESAGFEAWIDEKGEQVGWKSKDGSLEDALLVFGGNGGFGLRGSYYRERAELASGNWKVYLLEYPGYGNHPGKPSEASLTKAAIEAVDVLNAEAGFGSWDFHSEAGLPVRRSVKGRISFMV